MIFLQAQSQDLAQSRTQISGIAKDTVTLGWPPLRTFLPRRA